MLRPEAEVGAPGGGVNRGEGRYWQQHPAPSTQNLHRPGDQGELVPLEVAGCCVAGAWGEREMGSGGVGRWRRGVMEGWGVKGSVRVL